MAERAAVSPVHAASIVLSPTDRSASRSDGGVSPEPARRFGKPRAGSDQAELVADAEDAVRHVSRVREGAQRHGQAVHVVAPRGAGLSDGAAAVGAAGLHALPLRDDPLAVRLDPAKVILTVPLPGEELSARKTLSRLCGVPTPSKATVATRAQPAIPPPVTVGAGEAAVVLCPITATVTSALAAGAMLTVVQACRFARLLPAVSR